MRRALTSQLACTLLAARRAMSTKKRVGVLVKDGHAAWPPRLTDCDADLINAAIKPDTAGRSTHDGLASPLRS